MRLAALLACAAWAGLAVSRGRRRGPETAQGRPIPYWTAARIFGRVDISDTAARWYHNNRRRDKAAARRARCRAWARAGRAAQ